MHPKINSIYCIIPPHMLETISEQGSTKQRHFAKRALESGEDIRAMRQINLIKATRSLIATATSAGKRRTVYDAQGKTLLPGQKVRGEGDPDSGDQAVDEAYDGSGVTYDLFFDIYNRDSINDRGMPLESTVHFDQGYDNAFWDGRQMVYGDGDEDLPEAERLFNRFTIDIAVIGHELTHGVIGNDAHLVYENQPGALNESFADVFGSLVKQRSLGQSANQADWLVGEGLFTKNVNGNAIRSMKGPGTAYDDPVLGKDPQPGHMDDYQDVIFDNGGVHINSGIPNHAFYLAAMAIGGNAWEKAGKIWYITLRDKIRARSDFMEAARATEEVAGELYNLRSDEQTAVRNAWEQVGLHIDRKKTRKSWNWLYNK